MIFSSLIILGTLSAFSNIAYCEDQAQLNQPFVDLELCLVWPWKKPTFLSRSILEIAVVKCQPHEACIQQPDTQIYGMEFGRCQPTTRPNATKDGIECSKPEDCDVDGFPSCVDGKCVGFSWSPRNRSLLEIKDNGREVHCKTDKTQTVLTDKPVPYRGNDTDTLFWFEVEITNAGEDDVIAVGLCRKKYPSYLLPGWLPLSIAYHGDDGGIYVEDGRTTYYTNETFKEAKIGVQIDHMFQEIAFTKNSVKGHDGMMATCNFGLWNEALWDEELYPCVGFHFAKDAILRISRTWAKRFLNPLNNRSKEQMHKPDSCQFVNRPSVPTV